MSIKNGIMSGVLATLVCNPLDIIRLNIQSDRISSNKAINKIYKTKGILGFYTGITTGLATIPTFWAIFFPSYEYLKNTELNKGLCGYISVNLASTLTSPLWYIRQKHYTFSKFSILKEIKNKKFYQFYSGLSTTYIINANFIFQMPLYELLKQHSDYSFFNGALSKTLASLITYPLENLRVISRDNPTLSITNCFKNLIKNKRYYFGIFNYILRSIPYHGTIFFVYEKLNN
jgi:hypothetical protein